MKESVLKTRSGIYIRAGKGTSLLAFSPYTGLTYAVHSSEAAAVAKWLQDGRSKPPHAIYLSTLGVGWATKFSDARFSSPHLLPQPEAWATLDVPESPILINWFITGMCPLACKYCYAEDLMRDPKTEPGQSALARTAKSLLALNPLVVVLTGGDPLFGPNFPQAVELLSGRTGLIVDTSGYTFSKRHLELILQHRIAVRVSLDSEQPRIHQQHRPISLDLSKSRRRGRSTLEAALNMICTCLDAGVPVTVQTVATKKNVNDLLGLAAKLDRLGVHGWRILKVAPSQSKYEEYLRLVGERTDAGKRIIRRGSGPFHYVFSRLLKFAVREWKGRVSLQLAGNDVPNAIVLVGPNGEFYTESNVQVQKALIDPKRPTAPSLKAIRTKVNMLAHAERYLNITTTAYHT